MKYVQTPTARLPSALTSTSLTRAPAPSKNFVRGKTGFVPFLPGGLDAALGESDAFDPRAEGVRLVPPGFVRGLRLPGDEDIDEEFVNFEYTEQLRNPTQEVGHVLGLIRELTRCRNPETIVF